MRIAGCLLLTIITSAATAAETPGSPETARPNFLFFLADDQRHDSLGCAGHPILQTPTLDRLAQKGVRFTNMFVTTPICAASRATILTGLYERTHGFTFGTPPISAGHCQTSYPAVLKRAGYRTALFGKFGVATARGQTEIMFDEFKPLNRSPYFKKQPDGSERHIDEIAGDLAIEFLRNQPAGQPFCVSVSFNSPHAEDADKENHYPHPPEVAGLYQDVTIPPPRLSDPAIFESQPAFLRTSLNRERYFWRWDTREKYQKNMKDYYRMISGIDRIMGRVIAELDSLGLANNTVIIFAADNGYYMGNRGFAGKWSHYEESLRVPLIVYDPRLPADRRNRLIDATALNLDIAPTLADLAGVPAPAVWQGRSLAALVRGEPVSGWRTDFFGEHLFNHPQIPKWEGVRDPRYIYARYFEQTPPFEFLHDLEQDPDELKNLVADPAACAVLTRLRKRCDELRDSLGGPWSAPSSPRQPSREPSRD